MAEEEIPLDAATAMPTPSVDGAGAAASRTATAETTLTTPIPQQPVPAAGGMRQRTTSGSSNRSSGSQNSGMGTDLEKRPTRLFKRKQIFVEMDELRGETWRETHRWNFGLEEDLDEDGDPKWNHPHLPWYSATGMTSFYEELDDDNVFLDVPGSNIPDVVDFLIKKLLANGSLNRSNAPKFRHAMLLHSEQQEDTVDAPGTPTTKQKNSKSKQKQKQARKHLPSYKPDLSRERISSRDSAASQRSQEEDKLTDEELAAIVAAELAGGGGGSDGDSDGTDSDDDDDNVDNMSHSSTPPTSPTRKGPRTRTTSTSSVSDAPHIVHDKNAVDAEEFELLCPDEMEEAADILVGDVEWLDDDLIVFCRLKKPIDLRLERHAPGRFLVIVMGNFGDDASGHIRHLEIGEACAALLQDEEVVNAAYDAEDPDTFIDAIELKIHKLTMLPHIHRPTIEGVDKRLKRIKKELHEVSGVDMSHGGLEHYEELAQDIDLFHHFTLHNFLLVLRKWAIPLISGIIIALVLKNTNPEWYRNLESEPLHVEHAAHVDLHHANGSSMYNATNLTGFTTSSATTTPANRRYAREASASADHGEAGGNVGGGGSGDHYFDDDDGEFHTPVLWNLSLHGHGVTFHFVVNELLMCFFFGIAIQELTESLLPGGILYPPTREKLANPLVSTLGGVLGPIAVYFITLNIFDAAGAFDDKSYSYEDLASGWGIATATDISLGWATSYLVFGHDHPGVYFHLLMAIFDDGIGLIIIAVFYQTRTPEPIWLLLNLAAMVISYAMRKLKVGSWALYVLIPGPISWYGLFRSAIHPALALVFVVPFMPYHHKSEDKVKDDAELDADLIESGPNSTSNDAAAAAGGGDHGAGDDDGKPVSPLYHYGHDLSAFVDLFVMFLFGLVNAGVDLTNSGPYTFVILLSLLFGKTLGIGSLATMMLYLGYPLPTTLNLRGAWLVGLVNSVGLTVALFVAGQAFYDKPEIEGEAKLGALLSLSGSILTIIISKFIDIDPPGSPGYIAKHGDADGNKPKGEGDDESLASSHEDDDEFLEHVIAIEFMDQLKQMHAKTKQVEMDVQFSRAQNLARLRTQLHEREEESRHEQQRERLWLAKVHAADSEHNLYHAQHKDHFHHRHHYHAGDVDAGSENGSLDGGDGGSGGGGGSKDLQKTAV